MSIFENRKMIIQALKQGAMSFQELSQFTGLAKPTIKSAAIYNNQEDRIYTFEADRKTYLCLEKKDLLQTRFYSRPENITFMEDIYRYLEKGPATPSDIQEHFNKPISIVTSLLKILHKESLVKAWVKGNFKYFTIKNKSDLCGPDENVSPPDNTRIFSLLSKHAMNIKELTHILGTSSENIQKELQTKIDQGIVSTLDILGTTYYTTSRKDLFDYRFMITPPVLVTCKQVLKCLLMSSPTSLNALQDKLENDKPVDFLQSCLLLLTRHGYVKEERNR